jgi:hypothetical protein
LTLAREEEIALARIDWAHQRQLAAVAILLGVGIGTIELLSANLSDVGKGFFILLYIVLAGVLSYDLYAVFVFEREILRWQFRLIEFGRKVFKKNRWEIDFKESSFRFFFEYNDRNMPMRKNKVYTLPIVGFLSLVLLLLFKLFSVNAFPLVSLFVGFIVCIVPLTFFVLIFTEVFDVLFRSS